MKRNKISSIWKDKKYEPENARGTRLGKWFLILTLLFIIATVVHYNVKHEPPAWSAEIIIEAAKNNDMRLLKQIGDDFGVSAEEMKVWAADLEEKMAFMKRMEEREAMLEEQGGWKAAMEGGTMMSSAFDGDTGIVEEYWDVNNDGLCDYAIYKKEDQPQYWRYCDETGKPYG